MTVENRESCVPIHAGTAFGQRLRTYFCNMPGEKLQISLQTAIIATGMAGSTLNRCRQPV